jgi:hypothetical protein
MEENPGKLAAYVTPDEEKQNSMLDTIILKHK